MSQRVHLPAHVLQHLVHGIDLHFAFLKTLQGKADSHMLSCLHEQGSICIVGRYVSGEAFQQLLDVELGIAISLGEFFLQLLRLNVGFAAHFSKSGEKAYGLDDFLFL